MKWIYIPYQYSVEDGQFINLDKVVKVDFTHNEFSNKVRVGIYFRICNLECKEDSENGMDLIFKNEFDLKSNDEFIQEKIYEMKKLVKEHKTTTVE